MKRHLQFTPQVDYYSLKSYAICRPNSGLFKVQIKQFKKGPSNHVMHRRTRCQFEAEKASITAVAPAVGRFESLQGSDYKNAHVRSLRRVQVKNAYALKPHDIDKDLLWW
jgi:hypothetical protein